MSSSPDRTSPPPGLAEWLADFRSLFSRPVWDRVLVLVAGTLLMPGRHTVCAALRVLGKAEAADFATYHRVLSRARWSSRAAAAVLLGLIVRTLVPEGPVILGIDDTLERRWGAHIKARGIYRDPVRSSRGHFVKASGLRWLCLMVLAPIPWAGRVWALPFLSVLAPSQRYHTEQGRRHKTLTDWARQALRQVRRWLPDRVLVIVADSSFAAIELIVAVRRHACLISRLRLDANLFEPPPPRPPGRRGRPALKGARLPKLATRLSDPAASWRRITVANWYGLAERTLDIQSDTALWYHSGLPPVPIRWILVRDPLGKLDPQAFFSTDLTLDPAQALAWFVMRWQVEVTFQESRAHLGIETQRQWSDLAIVRTTPALLGLFSLTTLWAGQRIAAGFTPRSALWYGKAQPTFSDAIAVVRRNLWGIESFSISRRHRDMLEIPRPLAERMIDALCYAA